MTPVPGRARKASGCSTPLRGEIPAAADRAAHHGKQADADEDEAEALTSWRHPNSRPAQVVLEGGDADADAHRDGEGGRRQHHGLRRREGAEVAMRLAA